MRINHQRKNVRFSSHSRNHLYSCFFFLFRNTRRNWNEERRVNAETFGLKYRPTPQAGNQRSGYRRTNGRYPRASNGGYGNGGYGNGGYSNGGYGNRNGMYYGNFNNRVRAY